jgi:hypothetical protein
MEVKTLVYIIAGIIWLVFKNRSEIANKKAKSPTGIPTARPKDIETALEELLLPTPKVQRAPVILKDEAQNRKKEHIPKPFLNVNKNISVKNDQILSGFSDGFGLDKMPINGISDTSQNNYGATLPSDAALVIEDLRNGKLNLKQAFVLNEIFNPAWKR